MKKCKNCSTINEVEAVQCTCCSMKGMFISIDPTPTKPLVRSIVHNICRNCGSHDHGGGTNCKTCNFPLPSAKTKVMSHVNHQKTAEQ